MSHMRKVTVKVANKLVVEVRFSKSSRKSILIEFYRFSFQVQKFLLIVTKPIWRKFVRKGCQGFQWFADKGASEGY